jgi:hypothetical protein
MHLICVADFFLAIKWLKSESSVNIVSKLHDELLSNERSIPGKDKDYLFITVQIGLGSHPTSLPTNDGVFSPEVNLEADHSAPSTRSKTAHMHKIKAYGCVEVWLHSFWKSEHDVTEWSRSRPNRFTPAGRRFQ